MPVQCRRTLLSSTESANSHSAQRDAVAVIGTASSSARLVSDAPSTGCTRCPGTVASGRHRVTTQPPKPPPVIRAPNTPGRSSTCSHRSVHDRRRHGEVVAQAAVARHHQVARRARSRPAASASANAVTRAFSVITWRARRRTTSSSMRSTSSSVASRSGPTTASARAALAHPVGVLRPFQRAMRHELHDDRHVVGNRDRRDAPACGSR